MKGNINVNEIAEGEVREKINKAIEEVLENIRNLNTSPFDKRKVTLELTFIPEEDRELISLSAQVKTKLAPLKQVETRLLIGSDGKEVIASEFKKQIPGQTVMKVPEESKDNDVEIKIIK